MFTIEKKSQNRIDIHVEGAIDADEMRAGLDQLIEVSQDISDGQMLYTIKDFDFPSFHAIGVEISKLPSLFHLIRKFNDCALLCDQAWIRNAAQIEGALIPGLHIKSFQLNEQESAENWLSEQQKA